MPVLGVAALVAAMPARAQGNQQAGAYPQRAVTFVLPGPAGGGPDQVIRLLGDLLATRWGVPVVVDNKPGATGNSTFVSVGAGAPQVRAGKIRPLAVVSKVRSTTLPDVPTFAEGGVQGVDAVGWFGALAPAGTPPAVVAKLAADINAAVRTPAVAARLRELGFDPVTDSNPEAFRQFLRTEARRWQKLITDAGIKAE